MAALSPARWQTGQGCLLLCASSPHTSTLTLMLKLVPTFGFDLCCIAACCIAHAFLSILPPSLQGKARLGQIVHKKTAAALALTDVKGDDKRELSKIVDTAQQSFNNAPRVQWGGGIMGPKSQAKSRKRDKERQRELAQRIGA